MGGKATLKTVQGEDLTFARKRQVASHRDRREGRRRADHHRRRPAVERRHPRHQQGADPGLRPAARPDRWRRAPSGRPFCLAAGAGPDRAAISPEEYVAQANAGTAAKAAGVDLVASCCRGWRRRSRRLLLMLYRPTAGGTLRRGRAHPDARRHRGARRFRRPMCGSGKRRANSTPPRGRRSAGWRRSPATARSTKCGASARRRWRTMPEGFEPAAEDDRSAGGAGAFGAAHGAHRCLGALEADKREAGATRLLSRLERNGGELHCRSIKPHQNRVFRCLFLTRALLEYAAHRKWRCQNLKR